MLSIYHHDRYAKKLGGADNTVSILRIGRWPLPFTEQHDTDAHFWPYVSYVNGHPAETQISVAVQNKRPRGIGAHEAVLMHYLVVEYDAPGHGAMSAEDREEFLHKLSGLEPDSVLLRFACFYWTRAGARVIYRLRTPISFERYESKVRGLLYLFGKDLNLRFDPSSTQWWRCYRLPKVVRSDGKDNGPSWEQPYFDLLLSEEEIDADDIHSVMQPLPWEQASTAPHLRTEDMPDRDEAFMAVGENTEPYKRAKKRLRNSLAYTFIFEGTTPQMGQRDATLVKVTGSMVGRLFGESGFTPLHVYGLLLPLIDRLEADDAPAKAWRLVQHAWNAENEKRSHAQEQQIEASHRLREIAEMVIAQFPTDSVPDQDDEREVWGLQRMILVHGTNCYPLTRDGIYLSSPIRTPQVSAHLREHFPEVASFYRTNGSTRAGQDLINDFGVNIRETRFVAARRKGSALRRAGGDVVLEICPFELRQDIVETACYDEDVASWWRATGHYAVIRDWIENAVAIDEGGIAGLSLRGPKGCGKTLLALGLAEVWGTSPVSGAEAFSRFNSGLLRTPVVLCDEGLPKKQDGMSVPDMYRTMVVGSDYPIEAKFGSTMMSSIPPRFIFTANNPDIIKTLAGGRVLTREDTEALAQRLIHLDLSVEATAHFAARGGLQHTRGSARGPWIGGDPYKGGCRLARMIVWCYMESRKQGRGYRAGRLLVEGQVDTRIAALLEGGGAAPEVAWVMCGDIERMVLADEAHMGVEPSLLKNMTLHSEPDGTKTVWIRKMDYIRRVADKIGGRASTADVRRILDRWMSSARKADGFSMIRTEEILTIAKQEDIDCTALESISVPMQEIPK